MRELGKYDQAILFKFVHNNYNSFSREGLRYAIEKVDNPTRKRILVGDLHCLLPSGVHSEIGEERDIPEKKTKRKRRD